MVILCCDRSSSFNRSTTNFTWLHQRQQKYPPLVTIETWKFRKTRLDRRLTDTEKMYILMVNWKADKPLMIQNEVPHQSLRRSSISRETTPLPAPISWVFKLYFTVHVGGPGRYSYLNLTTSTPPNINIVAGLTLKNDAFVVFHGGS